jgi:hypothetical protein
MCRGSSWIRLYRSGRFIFEMICLPKIIIRSATTSSSIYVVCFGITRSRHRHVKAQAISGGHAIEPYDTITIGVFTIYSTILFWGLVFVHNTYCSKPHQKTTPSHRSSYFTTTNNSAFQHSPNPTHGGLI